MPFIVLETCVSLLEKVVTMMMERQIFLLWGTWFEIVR